MICLLLIMTMIFINSIESAEQKVRHSETLLKEEDMNAKTKAWLLMVESGRVDQEEFRRITPKSIFIAPLLTSRTGKCKEGYRHDHLGQCVKVIKIDPKVQLELLLQRLNKLYGEKKEEKEEEEEVEPFEVSSGPLHFSLPISTADEKPDQNEETKLETQQTSNLTVNATTPKVQNVPEFMPVPLPMMYHNQTKETESSGAEPLNETESYENPQLEGSGDGQTASGDGPQEEETTTPSQVSLISEESDYFDVTEAELTTTEDLQPSTQSPMEDFTSTKVAVKEVLQESYQNTTNSDRVNDSSTVSPKESIHVQEEIFVKNKSDSDKIYFPNDDTFNNGLRTPVKSVQSSRIRFPDEVSHPQTPSYHSPPDLSSTPTKHQIPSGGVPPEQFWWLPKNWQIDENQQKSALVKVWSRLPLMHDISHSPETADGFRKPNPASQPHQQTFSHQQTEDGPFLSPNQHQPSRRVSPKTGNPAQHFREPNNPSSGQILAPEDSYPRPAVQAEIPLLQTPNSTGSIMMLNSKKPNINHNDNINNNLAVMYNKI